MNCVVCLGHVDCSVYYVKICINLPGGILLVSYRRQVIIRVASLLMVLSLLIQVKLYEIDSCIC